MKSKGLTPWMPWIAVVVVLLIIGIGYYYHDSGVQSITKYYLIKYTPPLPETDVLGYPKMTDPEFEIKEEVSTFESDSAAVAKCKEDKKDISRFGMKLCQNYLLKLTKKQMHDQCRRRGLVRWMLIARQWLNNGL